MCAVQVSVCVYTLIIEATWPELNYYLLIIDICIIDLVSIPLILFPFIDWGILKQNSNVQLHALWPQYYINIILEMIFIIIDSIKYQIWMISHYFALIYRIMDINGMYTYPTLPYPTLSLVLLLVPCMMITLCLFSLLMYCSCVCVWYYGCGGYYILRW